MEDKGKTILVIGSEAPPAVQTLLESMRDDIIIVDPKDVNALLRGTSYPTLKPPEPFIITNPYLMDSYSLDGYYADGDTKRRERRKQERKNKRK